MNECVSRACKGAGRGVRSFNTNRFSATARPPLRAHLHFKCWGLSARSGFILIAAGQLLCRAGCLKADHNGEDDHDHQWRDAFCSASRRKPNSQIQNPTIAPLNPRTFDQNTYGCALPNSTTSQCCSRHSNVAYRVLSETPSNDALTIVFVITALSA